MHENKSISDRGRPVIGSMPPVLLVPVLVLDGPSHVRELPRQWWYQICIGGERRPATKGGRSIIPRAPIREWQAGSGACRILRPGGEWVRCS